MNGTGALATGLAQRKLVELSQKLDSLQREFDHWRAQSEAKQPLEKHNSQIRRVTRQLDSFREQIRQALPADDGEGEAILSRCRKIERQILEIHRIWEFFRSKLVPRAVDWFQRYLIAADEFAWACYAPARDRVSPEHVPPGAIKEPPLVFFNGSASPFAMHRNLAYQAERVAGEQIETAQFADVLKSLPIPVIGIPWFQIQHLPDALIIGHEVGHSVEDDFALSVRIEKLLKTAMESAKIVQDQRDAWHAWSGEVFADLYGTLATGPAFVGALIDFLAMSSVQIMEDERSAGSWGLYPTDSLRILLTLEALSQMGFQAQSTTMRASWETAYPSHTMERFEPDIPVIVRALLEGPYPELGGSSLKSIFSFTQEDHELAVKDAGRVLRERPPEADSARPLFAAARLAFEQESGVYETAGAATRILDRVLKVRAEGERERKRNPREEADVLAARAAHDEARGEQLYRVFSGEATADPGDSAAA